MNTKKNSLEQKITTAAQQAIRNQIFPGCAISVFSNVHRNFNFEVYEGRNTYDEHSRKIDKYSVFDIASITKTVVHLATHILVQEKKLGYHDKIAKMFDLTGDATDLIEVRHLLMFAIDFNLFYDPLNDKTLTSKKIMSLVKKSDLRFPPGMGHEYRDITTILLSMFLEKKMKLSIAEILEKYLFDRLGLVDIIFNPLDRFAPTYIVPTEKENLIRTLELGDVHDETATLFLPRNVGCSGLFARLPDLELLFESVLKSYDSKNKNPLFTQKTCELMNRDQLNLRGHSFTYGFDKLEPTTLNYTHCKAFNKHTMLATGFTGCSIMIEPIHSHVGILILSNRTYPERGKIHGIRQFRKTVANLVVNELHGIA